MTCYPRCMLWTSQRRDYSESFFFSFFLNSWNVTLKNVIKTVSEKKVECKTGSQMGAGQPGPLLAKSAGPTAKLRASGPRACSKSRPGNMTKSSEVTYSSHCLWWFWCCWGLIRDRSLQLTAGAASIVFGSEGNGYKIYKISLLE